MQQCRHVSGQSGSNSEPSFARMPRSQTSQIGIVPAQFSGWCGQSGVTNTASADVALFTNLWWLYSPYRRAPGRKLHRNRGDHGKPYFLVGTTAVLAGQADKDFLGRFTVSRHLVHVSCAARYARGSHLRCGGSCAGTFLSCFVASPTIR